MSRYLQTIVFILVILFSGCSLNKTDIPSLGDRSFENEDYLILAALEHQKQGDINSAIAIYNILYEKSLKIHYLIEATKISFLSNNNTLTQSLLEKGLEKYPNNNELQRLEIGFLTKEGKFQKAERKILDLLSVDKSARNLQIAGTIYFQLKSYNLALKYFESAYKIDTNANSLLNIIDIQYNYLDKKDDAIALLETHIRMQECEKKTCFKLIEIYGKEKNINGIISTYKKLYKQYKDDGFAKKIVELLVYLKDKQEAIEFLKESSYNPEMLLDIYLSSKDFKNAFNVSKKMYQKTNDINYLGKMAIYEYESQKNNLNKEILNSVSKKFEKVIEKIYDPLYLNYYGYLLIDHDIDIKKGINLVQAALLKEPNSVFYLDSLAWGYYKEGRCKEAKEIMDKLIKNSKEEELLIHSEKINKCVGKK